MGARRRSARAGITRRNFVKLIGSRRRIASEPSGLCASSAIFATALAPGSVGVVERCHGSNHKTSGGFAEHHVSTVTALTECGLIQQAKASTVRALHDDPKLSELFTSYLMERNIRAQEDPIDQLLHFHREAFGAASADLGESRGGFRRQARPCRGTFARVCGGAAPWLPPCPAKHQDGPCYRCDSRLTKIRCGSKSPCPTHNFWYLCEFGRFACGRPPLAACPTELPN